MRSLDPVGARSRSYASGIRDVALSEVPPASCRSSWTPRR